MFEWADILGRFSCKLLQQWNFKKLIFGGVKRKPQLQLISKQNKNRPDRFLRLNQP